MNMPRLTVALGLLSLVAVAADKPDFTGTWTLNLSKSDFGGRPAPIRSELKVVHKDPRMNVSRLLVTDMGAMTAETVYSTDGKETTNKLPNGSVMKSTAKWEGATLLIETPLSINEKALTIKWRWTLSGDQRRLTTVRTLPMGDGVQTEVFEK